MLRNQTNMPLKIVEKCGGEVGKSPPQWPTSGTGVAPLIQTPFTGPPTGARKKPTMISRSTVAGLVVIVLFAFSQVGCKPTTKTPDAALIPDVESIRAKAESGTADAQYQLGKLYAKGLGVKEDYKQAAKWYRAAADQGHAGAQVAMGELYEAGQGVPQDDAEAAKSYRRAADQGDAGGQYCLAVLYVMGRGVPQNNTEALKWYRLAADQGDDLAQYNLGMRHYRGIGVKSDPVEAYQWLSLAAAKGMRDAIQDLGELKRNMTREQISEGQRRAAAFVPKKPLPPAK